jgi:hypothetical protein
MTTGLHQQKSVVTEDSLLSSEGLTRSCCHASVNLWQTSLFAVVAAPNPSLGKPRSRDLPAKPILQNLLFV